MAGWQTAYEPRALIGMQVRSSLSALWAQRKRWARGQGEVLNTHLHEVCRWRNHRMWLLGLESLASLIWVLCLLCSLVLSVLNLRSASTSGCRGWARMGGRDLGRRDPPAHRRPVAQPPYDQWDIRRCCSARSTRFCSGRIRHAAIDQQITALIRGPREQRVDGTSHANGSTPRARNDAALGQQRDQH